MRRLAVDDRAAQVAGDHREGQMQLSEARHAAHFTARGGRDRLTNVERMAADAHAFGERELARLGEGHVMARGPVQVDEREIVHRIDVHGPRRGRVGGAGRKDGPRVRDSNDVTRRQTLSCRLGISVMNQCLVSVWSPSVTSSVFRWVSGGMRTAKFPTPSRARRSGHRARSHGPKGSDRTRCLHSAESPHCNEALSASGT